MSRDTRLAIKHAWLFFPLPELLFSVIFPTSSSSFPTISIVFLRVACLVGTPLYNFNSKMANDAENNKLTATAPDTNPATPADAAPTSPAKEPSSASSPTATTFPPARDDAPVSTAAAAAVVTIAEAEELQPDVIPSGARGGGLRDADATNCTGLR